MKFIHIADIHLGVKPDRNKPWGKEREKHSWQAFQEVIDRVEEEKIQLLLIAGDLFHRQPLLRELREVDKQFSRILDTKVVLIAGERDYLNPNSYYGMFPWKENVYFFHKEKMDYIELENLKTRIYGLSYHHREIFGYLYENIKVKEDGYSNILLAHGGDEKHIPFKTNELKKSVFDYVAFGHIHKPMQLVQDKVVMAGALQPISCNEIGEHGYFIGEIESHICHVEFQPINYCEYIPINLKVNKEITGEALREFVTEQIKKAPSYQFFKITLTGDCDADTSTEDEALEQLDRVAQVLNFCQPDYNFEKLKLQYEHQVIGQYINALEKMPQDEITKKALYYGVEAMMAK